MNDTLKQFMRSEWGIVNFSIATGDGGFRDIDLDSICHKLQIYFKLATDWDLFTGKWVVVETEDVWAENKDLNTAIIGLCERILRG